MISGMFAYFLQIIFPLLPENHLFPFKAFLLRSRGYMIGKNVKVASSVKIKLKYLSIGDNSYINFDTLITGGDVLIQIGNNVDIAPRCSIISGSHEIAGSSHRAGKGLSLPITIGDGTWIGAQSTILGGVTIGPGCVIGAGSLVRDDIPENSFAAGVPAKIIRKLT